MEIISSGYFLESLRSVMTDVGALRRKEMIANGVKSIAAEVWLHGDG
jgi:hypothetical protein